MRDDLSKLPLPKSAKKYARMTSKDLGSNWSKKVDMYMDMAADLTNQSKEGFKNKDASGKVKHAFKESAERIVARLLGEDEDLLGQMGDIADTPLKQYQHAREALNWVFGEGQGQVAAIAAALQSCGFVGDDGPIYVGHEETLADLIGMYLDDVSTGNSVDEACDAIQKTLETHAERLGIADGSVWALMKIFREEAQGIADTAEEYNQEMDDEIGAGEEDPDEVLQTDDRVVEESIKAAAVKCHDGTVIAGPPGADHIACCMMANQQGKSWDDEGLGFVTDDGRFVDRNEAEIEGMRHGQLRPEISDPGMVHARDFYWNESRGGYRYETCCVNADGGDISDMVDAAVDVTYEEFMRNVPLDQIFASGIGYGYDWPPAKLLVAGIDPREVGRQGLTLKKDWHVSYHKSTYQGRPCYFMCHSAIEYVFVKD